MKTRSLTGTLWRLTAGASIRLALALLVPASSALARIPHQYGWLNASQNPVPAGGSTVLTADVFDPDGDPVTITWSATAGTLSPTSGPQVTLTVPSATPRDITVTATADDGQGNVVSASLTLLVVPDNVAPFISLNANPLVVRRGRTTLLTATTNDPNGDPVSVAWTTSAGLLSAASGRQVTLTAPTSGASVIVTATADDGRGGKTTASLTLILVPRNLPPTIRLNANLLAVPVPGRR